MIPHRPDVRRTGATGRATRFPPLGRRRVDAASNLGRASAGGRGFQRRFKPVSAGSRGKFRLSWHHGVRVVGSATCLGHPENS